MANMGLILSIPILYLWIIYPIKSVRRFGPEVRDWSVAALIFSFSVLSFEASLNRPELMIFLGFFLGMIVASKIIEKNEQLSA
jgi:hypothetical protein